VWCQSAVQHKNVKPGNNGPESVLLTNVVAAGSEALLTANVHLVRVEETAEELPAGGYLIALNTLLLGNQVDRTGGRHASCKTVDALLLEVGNELRVVGNDSQAVTRRDERVCAVDHVAVTVTVTGSAEVNTVLIDRIDQGLCVHEVGIWVVAAEVGLGHAVLGAVGDAELLLEDVDTV
jgi:hypothetical protein